MPCTCNKIGVHIANLLSFIICQSSIVKNKETFSPCSHTTASLYQEALFVYNSQITSIHIIIAVYYIQTSTSRLFELNIKDTVYNMCMYVNTVH